MQTEALQMQNIKRTRILKKIKEQPTGQASAHKQSSDLSKGSPIFSNYESGKNTQPLVSSTLRPKAILLTRNNLNSSRTPEKSTITKYESSKDLNKKKKHVVLKMEDTFTKDSVYEPDTSISGVVERAFGKKHSCLLNAGSSIDKIN